MASGEMSEVEFVRFLTEAMTRMSRVARDGALVYVCPSQRLIINLPPRTLKSTIVSVAFVAWKLGQDPGLRFICPSYSDDLARALARDFRRLIEHPTYRLMFRGRLALARARIQSDRPKYVLIEDAANGSALLQALAREGLRPVIVPIRPDRDKESRLHGVTHVMERGSLVLPPAADWVEPYLQEMTTFPNARYDDQVDSTTQFLQLA